MKRITALLSLSILVINQLFAQIPTTHTDMQWDYLPGYSDEFNTGTLESKWNNNVNDWGTWSWEPENAFVSDTVLTIKMQHAPHMRGGKNYYFTSGIARIDETITYGYFEARIKAQPTWPSGAPAFWLYSVGQPTPEEEGGVQYSEIDVVEVFQIPNSIHDIEMNLHTRIIENGELTWKRPGQNEELHNKWLAPWDPRDEYHTYAALSRVDSIFWFVDGVERARRPNTYWHLPMHVTVSLGLRHPYEAYINGERTVVETPEDPGGFPTEMKCDYVRVWQAPPQINADRDKYTNGEYGAGGSLKFDYSFDAGSGYTVSNVQGLVLKLQEKNQSGEAVNEIMANDMSIVGLAAGKSSVSLLIPSATTLTADLPSGNYYALTAEFESTKEEGTVVALEEIKNIQIKDPSEILSAVPRGESGWEIYPNPADDLIKITGNFDGELSLSVYSLSGQILIHQRSNLEFIDVSALPAGVYVMLINDGIQLKSIRFSKK
ncbi:MAG: T9SS type A sorting domain-containing protein [Cyclobacteriaceae bacterium]